MSKGKGKIKVIDKGYKRIIREMQQSESVLKVGLFGSGARVKDNIAAIGAVQEVGANIKVTKKMRGFFVYHFGVALKKTTKIINIPSRPFMAQSFEKGKAALMRHTEKEYGRMIDGKIDAKGFLDSVGEFHTGQIRDTIKTGKYKSLSGLTVKTKGSSRALIDTGGMRQNIKHKIERK